MNTPRMISPILDGFQLNESIGYREGSVCCAATEIQSGKRFALKMISLPASDVQMNALIMTGAFSNRADANTYFMEQARGIMNEVKTLRYMATLGGFSDFDCVQVVPADRECGFDIYMLSSFQQSLEQMLPKQDLSQLEVINMGLDLCAALATSRHAGFCYVNLKPSNVFRHGQHYRIGDLGFIPVSELNRSVFPEKYRSEYTAPELISGSAPIGEQADIYALGLILYQAYNGGKLPGPNDIIGKLYAPPLYADYEMAQIILRACAPDPAIRWSDPVQMGRALTRYLQRNGLKNAPVIPPIVQELAKQAEKETEPFLPDDTEEETPSNDTQEHPNVLKRAASRPTRKRKERSKRKKSIRSPFKNKKILIAAAVLAIILAVELIVGIWLLGRDEKTDITDFRAAPGRDQHSITLYVEHTGDTPDDWMITFLSPDGISRTVTFQGESISIQGLNPGAEYTFFLSSSDGRTLTGLTQISYFLPEARG
jgi:serine/threonine-protein kinase